MSRDEFAAGAVAGVVQDAVMHPIDTLRAKLDMLRIPKHATKASGPVSMFIREVQRTVKSHGWRGLYGGYGVAVVGSMPANALYFGGYHFWRRQLGREKCETKLEWWRDILAGFGAQVKTRQHYRSRSINSRLLSDLLSPFRSLRTCIGLLWM